VKLALSDLGVMLVTEEAVGELEGTPAFWRSSYASFARAKAVGLDDTPLGLLNHRCAYAETFVRVVRALVRRGLAGDELVERSAKVIHARSRAATIRGVVAFSAAIGKGMKADQVVLPSWNGLSSLWQEHCRAWARRLIQLLDQLVGLRHLRSIACGRSQRSQSRWHRW